MENKTSLTVKFGSALLALLVLASIMSFIIIRPIIKNSIYKSNLEDLYQKEQLVMEFINNDESAMMTYVDEMKVLAPLFNSQTEFYNYLRNYAKIFGLHDIGIIDLSGNVQFSLQNAKFNRDSERLAINSAKNGTPKVVKTVTETELIFTAASLVDIKGNNEYSIIIFQKWISDNKYISDIARKTDTEIGLFRNDMRIGTSIKDSAGNYLTGTRLTDQNAINKVYNEGQKYQCKVEIVGRTFMAVYNEYKTDSSQKLMFCVGLDVNNVNSLSSSISWNVLITVFISLIIITLIVIGLLRVIIIRPTNKTLNIFNSILRADGTIDLSLDIEKTSSTDEIGQMITSIDKFLNTQGEFIRTVKDTSKELDKAAETLASNAHESAGASTEISANITSVSNAVTKQNETLSNVQNAFSTSIDKIQHLERLIESQSAGIVESSASIEEMVGNISSVFTIVSKMTSEYEELIKITNLVKASQEEVFEQANRMAQQSENLTNTNNVISHIASQTNLLAMNAAIEAAHAGEAGKGFAVVADEIRKLAENSSVQSKSIKTELDEIAVVIDSVVNATDVSRKNFNDIMAKVSSTSTLVQEINNAMTEQEEASKQILIALHEMNDSTSNVQSTSKEMSSSILSVKDETNNLEQIATTVAASMDEMTAGVVDITNAAQNVSDMAGMTKDKIKQLDKLIGKFKLD